VRCDLKSGSQNELRNGFGRRHVGCCCCATCTCLSHHGPGGLHDGDGSRDVQPKYFMLYLPAGSSARNTMLQFLFDCIKHGELRMHTRTREHKNKVSAHLRVRCPSGSHVVLLFSRREERRCRSQFQSSGVYQRNALADALYM